MLIRSPAHPLILAALAMIAAPAFAQRDIDPVARELPEFVSGSMWVKLDADRPQAHDATMSVVRALAGVEQTKTFWLVPGLHLVRVPLGDERAFVSLLRDLEGVEWTSVNGVGTVTNSNTCVQQGAQSQDQHIADQYWIDNVRLKDAWDNFAGVQLPDITIAVIDSGVNYNHPELLDNMWVNPLEIPANSIDEDNNGIEDDIHGAAFVSLPYVIDPCDFSNSSCGWNSTICNSCQPDKNDPQDATQNFSQVQTQSCVDWSAQGAGSHGTACAAIIAASANSSSIRGIACNLKIMALRVTPRCFTVNYTWKESDYIDALEYAVSNGASVISNSLQLLNAPGFALADAIKNLAGSDVVFVTSAGNADADVDDPSHPNASDVHPPQQTFTIT